MTCKHRYEPIGNVESMKDYYSWFCKRCGNVIFSKLKT